MSIKSVAAKLFASKIYNNTQAWAKKPVETQMKVFKSLINGAKDTEFGKGLHYSRDTCTGSFLFVE